MTEIEIEAATVARGTWLYDGAVPTPVRVVGLPFDYWHALAAADNQLQPGELARSPGARGLLYYVVFAGITAPSYTTIEEARIAAQARITSPICWA